MRLTKGSGHGQGGWQDDSEDEIDFGAPARVGDDDRLVRLEARDGPSVQARQPPLPTSLLPLLTCVAALRPMGSEEEYDDGEDEVDDRAPHAGSKRSRASQGKGKGRGGGKGQDVGPQVLAWVKKYFRERGHVAEKHGKILDFFQSTSGDIVQRQFSRDLWDGLPQVEPLILRLCRG